MDKIIISILDSLGYGKYGFLSRDITVYINSLSSLIKGFDIALLEEREKEILLSITDGTNAFILTIRLANGSRRIEEVSIKGK